MKSQHLDGITRAAWLASFKVGETRFVEVAPEDYLKEQKYYSARAPEINARFSTCFVTGARSTPMGAVSYLIRLERLE